MLKINFNLTKKSQRISIVAIGAFVLLGLLFTWTPASASLPGEIAKFISWPLFWILSLLGKLLVVLVQIMVQIAQFNNFVRPTAVQQGWTIVRDVCNMFLIIILLVIAWGTVLRIEIYHYKRTIPKFIIMAFLINFSKTIAGFFIDAVQIIMKAFTDAFADAAAGNLTSAAGLYKILSLSGADASQGLGDVVGALILGILLMAVMLGAILMIIFVLMGRILGLWILVILSPLAYLGEAFDKFKKLATQWWDQFGNYLAVGPLVAFFLWLAFTIMAANPSDLGQEVVNPPVNTEEAIINAEAAGEGVVAATISDISSSDNLLSFILAVGLLFVASLASQQMRTIGGSLGAKMFQGVSGTVGKKLAKAPITAYGWGARKVKSGALSIPGTAPDSRFRRIGKGLELNPGNIYRNIRQGMEAKRVREEGVGREFAEQRLRKGGLRGVFTGLGAPSYADTYMQGFMYSHGLKTVAAGAKSSEYEGRLKIAEGQLEDIDKQKEGYIDQKLEERTFDIDKDKQENRANEIQAERPDVNKEQALEMARREQVIDQLSQDDDGFRKIMGERRTVAGNVEELKQTVAKWQSYKPRDFVGQQERRSMVSEEGKKYNTTNEEELQSLQRGAVARGDVIAAQAIAMQSTSVGHMNELIEDWKAMENYYEHKTEGLIGEKRYQELTAGKTEEQIKQEFENGGRPKFKEGETLKAGVQGLHAYVNDVFVKKLKMDEQSALTLENDISNAAEKINHWNLGQAIGTKADGTLFQRKRGDSESRIYVERTKRDFEKLQREGNRLATMEEGWVDDKDRGKGRSARLYSYRVKELTDNWAQMSSLIEKNRFNVSEAEHIVKFNWDIIENVVQKNVQAKIEKDAATFTPTKEIPTKEAYIKKKKADFETFKTRLRTMGGEKASVDESLKQYQGKLAEHQESTEQEEPPPPPEPVVI